MIRSAWAAIVSIGPQAAAHDQATPKRDEQAGDGRADDEDELELVDGLVDLDEAGGDDERAAAWLRTASSRSWSRPFRLVAVVRD